MIKKINSVLVLSVFWLCVHCQNKPFDCVLLQKAIETETFKSHFFLSKYIEQSISIVDTSDFFSNCILSEIFGRKVNRHTNLSLVDKSKKNNIIIVNVSK